MKRSNELGRALRGRWLLCASSAFVALAAWAASGPTLAADAYPSKPVRMLVGFAAGGANDLVARVVATPLSARIGRTVVVENRPGAGGNVATEVAARSAPDGYTLLLGSVSSIAMGPALYKSVGYDPIKDFAPVTQGVTVPTLLAAHPSMSVRSLKEFVALAQRRPGAIDVGCPGFGSIAHLAGEMFKRTAKIDFVMVPYKGGAPALADVMGGQVGAMMSLMSTSAPHVQSGKLVGLAVTGSKRSPALPNIPTIAESGYPGYAADGWLGFLFPAGTPAEIVTRMHREIGAVLAMPDVKAQLEKVGMAIDTSATPDAYHAVIRADVAKWKKVVQEAKITLQ
ncbi:MAG: tripartite tricarboxylate transporter substrate binding protein [Betaproteobacteria bacterium]|nr:MAG: tripartite tricarboxylate transporter substrate binding protein [Betaproteobacteria bacterium]